MDAVTRRCLTSRASFNHRSGTDRKIRSQVRTQCNRAGCTKNLLRRRRPSSRPSPASRARSEGRRAGRTTCRRSTATSWRSMTTSIANSSPSRRLKRTNWRILMKARQRNERAMAQFHLPGPFHESPVQSARMTISAPTPSGLPSDSISIYTDLTTDSL